MLRYLVPLLALAAAAEPYKDTIAKWREQREADLKADGGWLTVTGLFWLKEGENRFPNIPGVFQYHNGKTIYGATEMGPQTSVTAGDLTLSVIERGGRYGVRVKDKQSELRKKFQGLHWFPVREQYRIQAKFVPYPKPRPVAIVNIIGNHLQLPSPGYAVFTIHGKEMRLEPVIEEEGAKELFLIFRDQTAGKETYPAGRYLYTDLPRDGKLEIDFNKAYSPPCAFTPYATCPLPPKQNILPVRIEAGELNPAH